MKLFSVISGVKRKFLTTIAVRSNVAHKHDLHVGPGSVIWAPNYLKLGFRVYVGKNVTIQVDGEIGDGVLFANGSGVVGRIDHDYTQIGYTVRDADWVGDHRRLSLPTYIGSDVWVGFNAVIQSGVKVGNSSIIAAGSVVTKDIPDNVIVAGVPARVLKARFSTGELEEHWRLLRLGGTTWSSSASNTERIS